MGDIIARQSCKVTLQRMHRLWNIQIWFGGGSLVYDAILLLCKNFRLRTIV